MGLSLLLFSLAASPPSEVPQFTIETNERNLTHQTVASLDPAKGLSAHQLPETIPVKKLISLRREGGPRPAYPRGPQIILANGDRLIGEIVSADMNGLSVQLEGTPAESPALKLPISALAAVWWKTPPATAPLNPQAYPWIDASKRRDSLLLKNGDQLAGRLEGFGAEPLKLQFQLEESDSRVISFSQLQALALDPTLSRIRTPKTAYVRLTLRGGSRLSVRLPSGDERYLKATTLFGAELQLPWDHLAAIDFVQNAVDYVSDLKITSKTAPFNALDWPLTLDRTVQGQWIELNTPLGQEAFDKGLGTHLGTEIMVPLRGGYRQLEGWVGLAPGKKRGTGRVVISLDGREQKLPEQGSLIGTSSAAVRIQLSVQGVQQLILRLEAGPSGDVQGHVNWGDLKLIRN